MSSWFTGDINTQFLASSFQFISGWQFAHSSYTRNPSGNKAMSPSPRSLRTVRASFPAYGSSITNAHGTGAPATLLLSRRAENPGNSSEGAEHSLSFCLFRSRRGVGDGGLLPSPSLADKPGIARFDVSALCRYNCLQSVS